MRTRWVPLAILAGLMLAACGGTAPAAGPASTAAPGAPAAQPAASLQPVLKDVTFRLSLYVQGYHAPYFLALDRGYYKQNGISLDIQEGKGSASTIQDVAAGHEPFGEADAGTAAALIAQGIPVKVVGLMLQQSPTATVYLPPAKLSRPADLRGLVIGDATGTGTHVVLPVFLGLNGLKASELNLVNVSLVASPPALMKHQIQAYNTFFTTDVPKLRGLGATDVAFLKWADFGFKVPGTGLIASTEAIAQDPNVVRGFVQATMQGWADAEQDPDAAVAALVKHHPDQNAALDKEVLKLTLSLLHAAETAGHPVGWMSEARWEVAIQQLRSAGLIKGDVPLSRIFTNEFIGG